MENQNKEEQRVRGYIDTLDSIEEYCESLLLTDDEYQELCDATATVATYLRLIRKRSKLPANDGSRKENNN